VSRIGSSVAAVVTEFVRCPDPFCLLPAEVINRFVLESTSGPMRLIKTRCVVRHNYTTEESDA
jgi:hypothetical protein